MASKDSIHYGREGIQAPIMVVRSGGEKRTEWEADITFKNSLSRDLLVNPSRFYLLGVHHLLKGHHCWRSMLSTGTYKKEKTVSGISYTNHNILWFLSDCRSLADPPGCSVGLSSDWLVSGFQLCLLSYARMHHVQWGRAAWLASVRMPFALHTFPLPKLLATFETMPGAERSLRYSIHLHYGDIHLPLIFPMTCST